MSNLRSTYAFLAVCAALVVGGAACSGSSPTAPPQSTGGQFTATVTGAIPAQMSGTATSMGSTSEPGFNIELRDANGVSGILLVWDGVARPGTGSNNIASTAEHGGNAPNGEFTAIVTITGAQALGSVTGTLTITASSASSVSGTFRFTGEDPLSPTRTVTVDGTFSTIKQDLP